MPDPNDHPRSYIDNTGSNNVLDGMSNFSVTDPPSHPDPDPSTIHRLPVEVLCAIFRAAGRCGMEMRTNFYIASVCSHWREVAHNDPMMWTCYEPSWEAYPPPETIRALVSRSNPCPIKFDMHIEPGSWMLEIAIANMHRISSIGHLDLGCLPPEGFPSLISLPAPTLISLDITFPHAWSSSEMPLISDAPRLKDLRVRGSNLPWNSKFYRNLQYLDVETTESDCPPCHHTESDILEAISASPDLESLTIYMVVPHVYFWAPLLPQQVPSPLSMHTLTWISLRMPGDYAMRILSGISLPEHVATVKLMVDCNHEEHIRFLLDFRYLPPRFLYQMKILEVDSDPKASNTSDESWSWTGVVLAQSYPSRYYSVDLRLKYTSPPGSQMDRELASLTRLLFDISLPTVERIYLRDTNPAASVHALAAMVVRARSITTLALDGPGIYGYLPELPDALLAATVADGRRLPRSIPTVRFGITGYDVGDHDSFAEAVVRLAEVLRPCNLHFGSPKVLLNRAVRERILGIPETWIFCKEKRLN